MEEQHCEQLKDQPSPKPEVCEECKNQPSKYKCPGCSLRSCSLPCVKAHKHRTGCSGNRNKTQFVPLSHFNDNLLISDYNLLEEIKRVAESAQRLRGKSRPNPQDKLPNYLRTLRTVARNRKTKLLLLPFGMSKRQMNQTQYNQSKKFISWTIEWRFHTTDVVLHDHGVHEDTNLCSVIEKHLKPGPWNNKLKQFCDEHLESLKFLIRKYPQGPKSPFCELDIKAPLRQQLANVTILEYPVIHVFLPSHSQNFEVIKVLRPFSHRPETKDPVNDNAIPIPEGVAFREEEIEDDEEMEDNNGSSDQQVYDVTQNETLCPLQEAAPCETSGKTLDGSTDGSLLARLEPDDNLVNHPKSTSTNIFEDLEFDFDEGFIDAYSDLIGQVNPDDFLELGGEGKDFSTSGEITLIQEELEEGEIWE